MALIVVHIQVHFSPEMLGKPKESGPNARGEVDLANFSLFPKSKVEKTVVPGRLEPCRHSHHPCTRSGAQELCAQLWIWGKVVSCQGPLQEMSLVYAGIGVVGFSLLYVLAYYSRF